VFHNASLSAAKRRKIEEVFGDANSGLNVLVSTSTLGAGVNL
jgi:replicative superfamily II helicase